MINNDYNKEMNFNEDFCTIKYRAISVHDTV